MAAGGSESVPLLLGFVAMASGGSESVPLLFLGFAPMALGGSESVSLLPLPVLLLHLCGFEVEYSVSPRSPADSVHV